MIAEDLKNRVSWQGDKKPRVAILGTSNGVMRDGYATELMRDSSFASCTNISIGFCSSDLFAFRASTVNFSEFDICILDFCCNDGSLFGVDFINEDHIRNNLRYAVAHITSFGCLPIFLFMPIESYLPNGGKIIDIYFQTVSQLGIPFFDGYKYIQNLSRRSGLSVISLFKDYMHLLPSVARLMAKDLSDSVRHFFRTGVSISMDTLACRKNKFDNMTAIADNIKTLATRKTSLIQLSLADFVGVSVFDIRIEREFELIGIAADFAHCNGTFSLCGENSIRIQLSGDLFVGDKHSLAFGVWPIKTPIRPYEGTVRVNVVGNQAADYAFNSGYEKYLRNLPMLSLAGCIFRATEETVFPYIKFQNPVLDLHSFISDEEIERTTKSLLSSELTKV